MNVQPIDSLGFSEETLYDRKAPDALGKEDFLALLVAQLEQQDPLNPQDPAEFTSQLTEFSNLEQLMTVNETLETLQLLQLSNNNSQATALLGKELLFAGNQLKIEGGAPQNIQFHSQLPAYNVRATVYDASGNAVRSISLGNTGSGVQSVAWDGNDAYGLDLPDGNYQVAVTGQDSEGNTIEIQTLAQGTARGVHFEDGVTYIEVDGQFLGLSDIYSVYQPAATQPSETSDTEEPAAAADRNPLAESKGRSLHGNDAGGNLLDSLASAIGTAARYGSMIKGF